MMNENPEDQRAELRRLEAELAEVKRRVDELVAELDREARWARHYYERWMSLRGEEQAIYDDGG